MADYDDRNRGEDRRETVVVDRDSSRGGLGVIIVIVIALLLLFFIIGNPFGGNGTNTDTEPDTGPDAELDINTQPQQ